MIRLVADNIRLATDKAVSVGVIVNELVGNACKYAYANGQSGEVRVSLLRENGSFRLKVEDDGKGFDPANSPKGTGIGTKLIRAMAMSLKAELDYGAGPAMQVSIKAPL
nr:sensor histidine kinase [Aurantimonas sp. VKM B-3413]